MKRLMKFVALAAVMPLIMAATEYSPTRLIAPEGNGLALTSTQGDCCDAKFTGQIWVSGLVSAQVSHGLDDEPGEAGEPELILVPDADSLKRLPYFSNYELKGIVILNYKDALSMVFGKELAEEIVEKKVNNEKVSGRFLIKDYEVGVDCNFPWANATLVSADVPPKGAVLGKHVIAYCG